jgi:hypothetical protein
LRETQAILRRTAARQNPQYADDIKNVDMAYALMTRPKSAAGMQGAQEGIFSPSQLRSQTRRLEGSKSAFAEGDAMMQDLAQDAESVLGQKVPDSGTPYRMGNLAGLAGALLGGTMDPITTLSVLGGGAAASTLYTDAGRKLAAALLAQRPDLVRTLGQGSKALAPVVGSGAASLFNSD